jgi:hypothetical protein
MDDPRREALAGADSFGDTGPNWRNIAKWLGEPGRMPSQIELDEVWDEARALVVKLQPTNSRTQAHWSAENAWADRWMRSRGGFGSPEGTILMSKMPLNNEWEIDFDRHKRLMIGDWAEPASAFLYPKESPWKTDLQVAYFIWVTTATFYVSRFFPNGATSQPIDPSTFPPESTSAAQWEDLRLFIKGLRHELSNLVGSNDAAHQVVLDDIANLMRQVPEWFSLFEEEVAEN